MDDNRNRFIILSHSTHFRPYPDASSAISVVPHSVKTYAVNLTKKREPRYRFVFIVVADINFTKMMNLISHLFSFESCVVPGLKVSEQGRRRTVFADSLDSEPGSNPLGRQN
ncbi:hypothetical protein V6N13_012609 [Hibiscus sabdariffa]